MNKQVLILLFACLFCYVTAEAQVDLQTIFIEGKVIDKTSGKGIEKVPVSDGYNIVLTDKEGRYELITNRSADFVMITVPSTYEIPMENGLPALGKKINKQKEKEEIYFELTKLSHPETNHRLIVFADPQILREEEFPLFDVSIKDMQESIRECPYPSYGLVCGDIVFDKPELFAPYKEKVKQLNCPVFHTKGNHDMTLGNRSAVFSPERFREEFGTEFYSFNRGNVHYVVLDDVMHTARGYNYIGYVSERQMNWLKQDLELVKPGSLVILMFHIPVWSLDHKQDPDVLGSLFNCMQNRQALFDLLEPFNAHIFSGHTHSNENYPLATNLYEHVHGGVCGSWWQTDLCTDGSPAGYGVYDIQGDDITWYYKSTGKDKSYQAVFYPAGTDKERPGAVIANVWNWDPEWKVNWYENGQLKGEMTQYIGTDPCAAEYFEKHRSGWIHKWIHATTTDHLFYAIPGSPQSKIRIEITDRFGNTFEAKQITEY